jgi:hypothetical protein
VGPSASLGAWVLAWAVIAVLIVLSRLRSHLAGAGLVAAYALNFAMVHWIGAAIYLQPSYARSDPDVVALGLQQATYAIAAFGVGSVLVAPRLASMVEAPRRLAAVAPARPPARTVIGIGMVVFLGLFAILPKLPTVSALLSQGWILIIVGLALACWNAWHTRRREAFSGLLAATLLLPLFTVVTQGFIGFGTAAALAVMSFIASFFRPRWQIVLAGLVLGYLGLSVFVTYMRDRADIRATVWGGESLPDRVGRVYQTVSTLEWFNLSNTDHLDRIDERLNQNYLVGKSVTYIDEGLTGFAGGETVWNGILGLVPRAIWPTKPVGAGSGALVARFTGLAFAESTSVGIGSVMEAYIGFGSAGIVGAFVLLGTVVALIDAAAARRLRAGNWRGFLLWYLPGLNLLQVGGSFVEVTSAAGAALVVAVVLIRLVRKAQTARTPRPRPTTWPVLTRA